jgi:tight adherence protein B
MTSAQIFLIWCIPALILVPRISRWWLDQGDALEQRLVRRLEDFHLFVGGASVRWALMTSLAVAAGFAILVFQSVWALPLSVIGTLAIVFAIVRWRLSKRLRLIRYQLPPAIELIATSLRAGLSIRAALIQVAKQAPRPISQEMAVLDRMQRIGTSLESAFSDWFRRRPLEEIGLLGFTISVSSASGGNLSDALDRLAEGLRQRLILEEKVDALTAQGRMQAWVMAALPPALALALTALDPVSMAPLWSTTHGHLVVFSIVILELFGMLWIRRLVRADF